MNKKFSKSLHMKLTNLTLFTSKWYENSWTSCEVLTFEFYIITCFAKKQPAIIIIIYKQTNLIFKK